MPWILCAPIWKMYVSEWVMKQIKEFQNKLNSELIELKKTWKILKVALSQKIIDVECIKLDIVNSYIDR